MNTEDYMRIEEIMKILIENSDDDYEEAILIIASKKLIDRLKQIDETSAADRCEQAKLTEKQIKSIIDESRASMMRESLLIWTQ